MPTIKTYTTYKFDELSDSAKDKAIEKLYDINTDHNWHGYIYENHKEIIKSAGFDITKIYFSGFSSQGDGAMFEYDGINKDILIPEFAATLKIPNWKRKVFISEVYVNASGKQRGHYYHERSCEHYTSLECNTCGYDNIADFIGSYDSEFEEFVKDKYVDLAQNVYSDLEKEYDYLTSRAAIIETIEANDYDFDENGNLD